MSYYKVVGIQIVPKNYAHNKNIVNQVAWKGLENCRALFEKLLLSERHTGRTEKKRKDKKFTVVGVMTLQQEIDEVLFDMEVSGGESGLSKDVRQRFNDMVRTLN